MTRYKLANRLRELDLSHQKAVDAMHRLAPDISIKEELKLDRTLFSKWVRGTANPGPVYVYLLCLVVDRAPAEVDLAGCWPFPFDPRIGRPGDMIPLDNVSQDQAEEPVDRRGFTKGIVGIGSLVGTLNLAAWERVIASTVNEQSVDDLESALNPTITLRPGHIGSDEIAYLHQTVSNFERRDAHNGGVPWRKAVEMALHQGSSSAAKEYAARAETHTESALSARSHAYQRSRVLDTLRLANVRLAQAEWAEAVSPGTAAIELSANISSGRVIERLVALHRRLRLACANTPEFVQFDGSLRIYLANQASPVI